MNKKKLALMILSCLQLNIVSAKEFVSIIKPEKNLYLMTKGELLGRTEISVNCYYSGKKRNESRVPESSNYRADEMFDQTYNYEKESLCIKEYEEEWSLVGTIKTKEESVNWSSESEVSSVAGTATITNRSEIIQSGSFRETEDYSNCVFEENGWSTSYVRKTKKCDVKKIADGVETLTWSNGDITTETKTGHFETTENKTLETKESRYGCYGRPNETSGNLYGERAMANGYGAYNYYYSPTTISATGGLHHYSEQHKKYFTAGQYYLSFYGVSVSALCVANEIPDW